MSLFAYREIFLPLKDQRRVIGEEVVKSVISENKVPVTSFSVKFSSFSRALMVVKNCENEGAIGI